jgi:hypothetical protein
LNDQTSLAITKQVEEYKAQIKTVETNYALGKITEEIYTRVLSDIHQNMDPLRVELAKGIFQLSKHEKMVVSAVTNLSNLLTMWDKQDLMGRKLLVKTLYPKGIVLNRGKTLYRTQNRNIFIEYIQDVTGDNGQI